jgi:hypothetical protein
LTFANTILSSHRLINWQKQRESTNLEVLSYLR